MGKRTSIRLYKSGDAKGINEMFTKHTPYLRDDAYWTWINRIVGQSISVVAECDDRMLKIRAFRLYTVFQMSIIGRFRLELKDGKRLLYLNPMNCLRIRGLTILRLPYSLMRLRILIMNICFD